MIFTPHSYDKNLIIKIISHVIKKTKSVFLDFAWFVSQFCIMVKTYPLTAYNLVWCSLVGSMSNQLLKSWDISSKEFMQELNAKKKLEVPTSIHKTKHLTIHLTYCRPMGTGKFSLKVIIFVFSTTLKILTRVYKFIATIIYMFPIPYPHK